jgi:phosphatidylglycerol:prolipoprotein diacylglycerol transferase
VFPVIQLGPLAIQSAGLFLLASLWIGITLTEKRAAHSRLKSASLDNLILFALFGFLAGGRLSFAALHWESFLASPLDIFSINTALFDLTGGLAAGLIVALVYGQRKGLPFWSTLDALTPLFATVMVGLGASHLASGEAFGKGTSLPWGIELFGAVRHPSQVYEIAAALFILNLIGLRKPFSVAGTQFLAFLAGTAGARLFLEAFRGDSTLVFGGLRLGQILAWIVLAVAFFGFERLQSERKNTEIQA